jgi:DNA replication protein DnaC
MPRTTHGLPNSIRPDDFVQAMQRLAELTGTGSPRPLAECVRQARVMGFPTLHTDTILAGGHDLDPDRQAAWSALTGAVKRRGLVILHGRRGGGKTHMGTLLGVQWRRYGFAGRYGAERYWRINDLLDAQKAWYGRKVDANGNAIAEPHWVARDCGLLVLDEVNEIRRDREADHDAVVRIVDARYGECRPTVLITNLAPADMPGVLGGSILDRVKDRGALIECNWNNYRDEIRKGGAA